MKKPLTKLFLFSAVLITFTACQQKTDTGTSNPASQPSSQQTSAHAPSLSSQQITTQQLGELNSKVSVYNQQKSLEWNLYGSPDLNFKFPKDWIVTVAKTRKDNPANYAITTTAGQLKISNENPDPQAKYFTEGYEMDISIMDKKEEIPKNLKETNFKNIKQDQRSQEYYFFGMKNTFKISLHSVYNTKNTGTDKMFSDATNGILSSLKD